MREGVLIEVMVTSSSSEEREGVRSSKASKSAKCSFRRCHPAPSVVGAETHEVWRWRCSAPVRRSVRTSRVLVLILKLRHGSDGGDAFQVCGYRAASAGKEQWQSGSCDSL